MKLVKHKSVSRNWLSEVWAVLCSVALSHVGGKNVASSAISEWALFWHQGSENCKYLQIILCKNTRSHTNNKQIKYEILYDVKCKIESEIVGFRILTNWQFNHLTAKLETKLFPKTVSELEQQRKI